MPVERDEIEAICRQVLADRKRKKDPMTAALPLRFDRFRKVGSADGLSPDLLRQAVAVGRDGVGYEVGPEEVFGGDAQEEGLYDPEVWDVLDATGALAYRVWMYGVDNGTVFRGDTVEIVAGCSQGGLESDDEALVDELIAARERVDPVPEGSFVKFLG